MDTKSSSSYSIEYTYTHYLPGLRGSVLYVHSVYYSIEYTGVGVHTIPGLRGSVLYVHSVYYSIEYTGVQVYTLSQV